MKTNGTLLLTGSFLALLFAASARAEYFTDKDLVATGPQPGSLFKPVTAPSGSNSISEGWKELTAGAYPDNDVTFPGTGAWPAALESQVGADFGTNALV